MVLKVNAVNGSYDIVIGRGTLACAARHIDLNRKVLIVTDSGVPAEYLSTLKGQCAQPYVYVIEQGENSKNIQNYQDILGFLVKNSFTRTDAVVALGGGVVGDLSGFVSATYMRGIDFYNIPTTLLSQVDSSIGGKTAIDFGGIKNIVGAFYQPKTVIIDCDTLKTLDKRQLHSGLVEAIKMSATCDKQLFDFICRSKDLLADIDEVVYRSLLIKKKVVEEDALERGVRKILNFGHTVGHAVESCCEMNVLHGECVAIGMVCLSEGNVKARITEVLKKYDLPTSTDIDKQKIIQLIRHDKKSVSQFIDVVVVPEIGQYAIKRVKIDDIINYL